MNKLVKKIRERRFPVLFGFEDIEKLKFNKTEISEMFEQDVQLKFTIYCDIIGRKI